MPNPDRTAEEIAEEIAKMFGDKDQYGEWWGFDTTLGDVITPIADAIRQAEERTINKISKIIKERISKDFSGYCEDYQDWGNMGDAFTHGGDCEATKILGLISKLAEKKE